MIRKLSKAVKDPGYAIRSVVRRYLKFDFGGKIFAYSKDYRSDSEDGTYGKAVVNALRS